MADTKSFENFMKTYQNLVFSVAVRLLGNDAEAADISQEVFLKAYDRFADLQHNPSAPGWLRTVTHNLCLNHLTRYRARWRFFSEFFRSDSGRSLEDFVPDADNQSEKDDREFRRHHLEKALRRLPKAQRVPLVLYHFEEMSYEEIARRLGVSLSKVKTDIHRARESLRRWLRPDLDHWEDNVGLKSDSPKNVDPGRQQRVPWTPWPAALPFGLPGLVKVRTA
jgi:RNA polymerase sigma-70 factor (ECF subfamily)